MATTGEMALVFTTAVCPRFPPLAPFSISYLQCENSGTLEPIGQVRLAAPRSALADAFGPRSAARAIMAWLDLAECGLRWLLCRDPPLPTPSARGRPRGCPQRVGWGDGF